MINHTRSLTSDSCETEDITSQIDRLNKALELIMQDIDESSYSQSQSRASLPSHELKSESNNLSDDSELDIVISKYESTIEALIHLVDQQQMIIEDFVGEHLNKSQLVISAKTQPEIAQIKEKLISELSAQNEKDLEQERSKIREKIQAVSSLKEDYYKKRSEILLGIEKLRLKEQLLAEKEKQLKHQKTAFEKQKERWEKEMKTDQKPLNQNNQNIHVRSSSNNVPLPPKIDTRPKHLPMEIKASDPSPSKQDQIKHYQTELKQLEDRLKVNASSTDQLRVVTMRNKIAALRGEMIIQDSLSLQKNPVLKDEDLENKALPNLAKTQVPETDSKKANLEYKAKDEIEIRRKDLIRKEKELASREAFLHEIWMRVPGGKELVENVKITLGKLNSERKSFEKERKEFYMERAEWLKSMERGMRNRHQAV